MQVVVKGGKMVELMRGCKEGPEKVEVCVYKGYTGKGDNGRWMIVQA